MKLIFLSVCICTSALVYFGFRHKRQHTIFLMKNNLKNIGPPRHVFASDKLERVSRNQVKTLNKPNTSLFVAAIIICSSVFSFYHLRKTGCKSLKKVPCIKSERHSSSISRAICHLNQTLTNTVTSMDEFKAELDDLKLLGLNTNKIVTDIVDTYVLILANFKVIVSKGNRCDDDQLTEQLQVASNKIEQLYEWLDQQKLE
ncbi:hypothetical protein GJ496_002992 [Pomphorhynchus laevis]|nr:hypothetical protein GJ496_002992 [Pomphorhynchus laevis]